MEPGIQEEVDQSVEMQINDEEQSPLCFFLVTRSPFPTNLTKDTRINPMAMNGRHK